MKLRINLMCHSSRRELWHPLQDSLPHASHVYEDDGRLGRWGNGRRCVVGYGPDDTHVLILQDDALPAADLIAGLYQWTPQFPDAIQCLYNGKLAVWRRIVDANAQVPCFMQMEQIQWGVALVIPVAYIPALIRRADMLTKIDNFDMRLSEANMRTNKLPVIYPFPSWVEHAETPSTVAGRKGNRHALRSLTQDESVLDWGVPGEVPIKRVPDFQRRAGGRQWMQGR